jgi:putative CocE/NonD family hydrolase
LGIACALSNALARGGAAVQAWEGWMDAGTADGALSRFMAVRNPQTVILGPWSHALGADADPFHSANAPLKPTAAEKVGAELAFLDPYLKGSRPPKPTREIRYYTLGAGTWHTTSVWPPRGLTTQHWYLAANGRLARERPIASHGADRYTVDFTASSGNQNRWHTQAGGDVVYPDRAKEDRKLLTYTSSPMARNVEITGHPIVSLDITSTTTDGAFIVYLEDVAPNGRVTYITEGELRALHRKISNARPPYPVFGPYHSFRRADAEPLVPGRSAELRFALLPTSVLIRRNHRIRIAIAGADKGTFARIPATGDPLITVARNATTSSRIDLPVRSR